MSDIDQLITYLNQTTELALRVAQRLEELERRGMVDVEARAALVSLQAQVATLSDSYAGHVHHWNTITNKPATFPPAAHTHAWDAITDKPATFPPETHGNSAHTETYITGVSWEQVTGKPSTFTPATHGNEAHNPDFATQTEVDQISNDLYTDAFGGLNTIINSLIPAMKSAYNTHTHTETGSTTSGPSASM